MAITLKHFMQGIANAAPELGRLAYNTTMLKYEMAFREREVRAKEAESAASVEYTKAQTEATQFNMEQAKLIAPLTMANARVELRKNELARNLEEKKFNTYDADYQRKVDLELQQLKAETARIEAYGADKLAAAQQQQYYQEKAKADMNESQLKIMTGLISMMDNPDDWKRLPEYLEKHDTVGDVIKDMASDGVLADPRAIGLQDVFIKSELEMMVNQDRADNEIDVYNARLLNDPEAGKDTRKSLGDGLYPKGRVNMDVTDALIADRRARRAKMPTNERIMTVNKSIEEILYGNKKSGSNVYMFNPFQYELQMELPQTEDVYEKSTGVGGSF